MENKDRCSQADSCLEKGVISCPLVSHMYEQATVVSLPWTEAGWKNFLKRYKEYTKNGACPLGFGDQFINATKTIFPTELVTQEERNRIMKQKEDDFYRNRGQK